LKRPGVAERDINCSSFLLGSIFQAELSLTMKKKKKSQQKLSYR